MKPKKCPQCGETDPVAFNKDGFRKDRLQNWCRECAKERWHENRERETVKYTVIYDPINSFSKNSTFSRNAIEDMLKMGYLAIGTRFRCGKSEYRVNDDMCLTRETAGVATPTGVGSKP